MYGSWFDGVRLFGARLGPVKSDGVKLKFEEYLVG